MNKFSIALLILATVFLVNYFVFAVFREPTSPPPSGNVPAPVNVGPDSQRKSGNLEVDGLKSGAITLGGVTRTNWPSGSGGAACAWEGTKCSCAHNDSTWADLRMVMGITCRSGEITDFGIKDLYITSRTVRCSPVPPPGCNPELYTVEGY